MSNLLKAEASSCHCKKVPTAKTFEDYINNLLQKQHYNSPLHSVVGRSSLHCKSFHSLVSSTDCNLPATLLCLLNQTRTLIPLSQKEHCPREEAEMLVACLPHKHPDCIIISWRREAWKVLYFPKQSMMLRFFSIVGGFLQRWALLGSVGCVGYQWICCGRVVRARFPDPYSLFWLKCNRIRRILDCQFCW